MNVDEDKLREIIKSEISGLEVKLDSKIDAQFDVFTNIIDTRFEASENRINARFKAFEVSLAGFFGQTNQYFDKRFDKFERTFSAKFDSLQNSVDGIVKRLDDDDVERMAVNNQLVRHETWINELAGNTNTTLSTP